VDAELDERRVNDVSETENVIVSQWREVSAVEQHELRDEVDEILRPLGFEIRLVAMRRANSIALYFICLTLSAIVSLRDHWCRGQLRRIVEELFTLLSGVTDRVEVKRLIWPLTYYEQYLKISSKRGKQTAHLKLQVYCIRDILIGIFEFILDHNQSGFQSTAIFILQICEYNTC